MKITLEKTITTISFISISIMNLSVSLGLAILLLGGYKMLIEGDYIKHYDINYIVILLLSYSIYLKLYINPNKK